METTGRSACGAPAGCGQRLEMMQLKEVKPRWDVSVDSRGHEWDALFLVLEDCAVPERFIAEPLDQEVDEHPDFR